MKQGTGGDPFGDDDPVADGQDDASDTEDESQGGEDSSSTQAESGDAQVAVESGGEDAEDGGGAAEGGDDGLPWAVERNSVKSEREMVQFYLRGFVQERESRFQREVESKTGYDTYLTDVREAAYLVAMDHPDEVAELLDEWGCEYD
ncbi:MULTISPECIES: hypothetical protein [Halorussus]|uniref:hypothetical protein n=1 Tax=Halorussus TaxID=1070314 RepID=UPI00209F38C9|nr:hypothetical protein [Halorussus vallis]USZ78279.1 hypothetical protein NGM07_23370 [Halorussus vallis]